MKTFLVLTLLALVQSAVAEPPKRVLFIGNSYTSGIRGTLNAMLKHEGIDAEVEYLTPGGKTLAWHWENGSQQRIREGNWDVVVLQDQSQTPAYPGIQESFFKAGGQLVRFIQSQGAQAMFYMTWGRRDGDKQNRALAPDYTAMQDRLSASYAKAAEMNKASLAPCGEAWRRVREADPALGKKLYKKDGSHPSAQGAYLVAATFTAILFEKAPSSIRFEGGLNPAERKVILRAVEQTLRH